MNKKLPLAGLYALFGLGDTLVAWILFTRGDTAGEFWCGCVLALLAFTMLALAVCTFFRWRAAVRAEIDMFASYLTRYKNKQRDDDERGAAE